MEIIITIFLYDSFIELPESNLNLCEKARTLFTSLGSPSREKEDATKRMASEDLVKCKGKSKENNVTV